MRMDYDGHKALVSHARFLGMHAQTNHLVGWEILKGVKVSRIIGLYGKLNGDWLWRIFERIVGKVDRNQCKVFASAVFILDLHYRLSEDREEKAFHGCNLDFFHNCIKCVRFAYGWWNPRRYLMTRMVKSLYRKMDENGYMFWHNKGIDMV